MKAVFSLAALCMMNSGALAASYEQIEDLSHLPLLNPDLKERKTSKIRLANGLEALLISDPGAEGNSPSL